MLARPGRLTSCDLMANFMKTPAGLAAQGNSLPRQHFALMCSRSSQDRREPQTHPPSFGSTPSSYAPMEIFAYGSSIPMGLRRLWPAVRGRVGSQRKTKPLDVHRKHGIRRTRIRPPVLQGEVVPSRDRAPREVDGSARSWLHFESGVRLRRNEP